MEHIVFVAETSYRYTGLNVHLKGYKKTRGVNIRRIYLPSNTPLVPRRKIRCKHPGVTSGKHIFII